MQAQWRRFEEDIDDVVPLAYGMNVPGQSTTTRSVGVQVPGEETSCDGDGCRLLEPGPIEEQGDSSPVTQEMECGGEPDHVKWVVIARSRFLQQGGYRRSTGWGNFCGNCPEQISAAGWLQKEY